MRLFEFTKGYNEHRQLNPKLWDGDSLRPEVKDVLIKIAKKFEEFIDLNVPVVDIQITGGQTTYHYTEKSDLDLHLIIDYNKIECDEEIAELLDTKRLLFKQKHSINIRQIPVEPGTEDINRPTVSSAYSIVSDQWIREPKNFSGQIDHEKIKKHTLAWSKLIDKILGKKDVESAKKLLKMIRKYRKIGLKRTGEYGVANLVYKSLRNSNKIQQLSQFIDLSDDQALTIQDS
jgi:hypothetical protein